jgi:hypothetical protein
MARWACWNKNCSVATVITIGLPAPRTKQYWLIRSEIFFPIVSTKLNPGIGNW